MDAVRTASTGPPVTVKKAVRTFSMQMKNRNWRYLGVDWAVIAASVGLQIAVGGILLYVVVCIVIGSRLRALANLLHESAHYKLFPAKKGQPPGGDGSLRMADNDELSAVRGTTPNAPQLSVEQ